MKIFLKYAEKTCLGISTLIFVSKKKKIHGKNVSSTKIKFRAEVPKTRVGIKITLKSIPFSNITIHYDLFKTNGFNYRSNRS